jgi:hypothetical protein
MEEEEEEEEGEEEEEEEEEEEWSAADRFLESRVRIPPAAWMSVSCECCVLSGRGFCDGPHPRPAEPHRVWCVCVISKPQK